MSSSSDSTTTVTLMGSQGNKVRTWWHPKGRMNEAGPVGRDEVRQSHKYLVSVSAAGQLQPNLDSFVYETIPRNGNGKMKDPENPAATYSDDDGISIEMEVKITMAWTQFEYSEDVDLKIRFVDKSDMDSNFVIRPTNISYKQLPSPDAKTLVIRIPYNPNGLRFSVEFQHDLFSYQVKNDQYVISGGMEVSREPRNALLIFASPFLDPDRIHKTDSSTTHVLQPGPISSSTIGTADILYFKSGVYWMENPKDLLLANHHIKLNKNTHTVYFEPGTYLKGAIEYTTEQDFFTIGHAVISGENYAYMANENEKYQAIKDDWKSLRMISHRTVEDYQRWTCIGPTTNAPPFNTVDLWPKDTRKLDHEEDNLVKQTIDDYKQVGAFYFQTDGPQIYDGEVRNCFWHVNDDAIKLYHSKGKLKNIIVWKCHNDPVIQFGWKPRNVSDVSIDGLDIIHTRYVKAQCDVPSAIIGASGTYTGPNTVDPHKTISAKISNVRCEGWTPALLRIRPLQNYKLTLENITFEALFPRENNTELGESLVGTGGCTIPGQESLKMDIKIKNWVVDKDHLIVMEPKDGKYNGWQSYQRGQLNINGIFWGQWGIEPKE